MKASFEMFRRSWKPNKVVLPCPSAPRIENGAGWAFEFLLQLDDVLWGRWMWWLMHLGDNTVASIKEIPQIDFLSSPCDVTIGMLRSCLDAIGSRYGYSASRTVPILAEWISWSLDSRTPHPPADVTQGLHEELYQTFCLDLMIGAPYDYFGALLSESGHGKSSTAFFPTPMEVVKCMAKMGMFDVGVHVKVCDPCVGTGRTLMVAGNHALHLTGQDIDHTVLVCAKANFMLYVPWGAAPAPPSAYDKPPVSYQIDERGQVSLF